MSAITAKDGKLPDLSESYNHIVQGLQKAVATAKKFAPSEPLGKSLTSLKRHYEQASDWEEPCLSDGEVLKPNRVFSESVKTEQKKLDQLNISMKDDGLYGPITTAGVEKFQAKHDLPVTGLLDGGTRNRIEEEALKRDVQHEFSKAFPANSSSKYGYSDRVKDIIATGDPQKLEYIQMATDAANKWGIDPVLFVNQMANESMGFDPSVINGKIVSPKYAMGIAQFTKDTGNLYGLHEKDFFDAKKSLDAGAHHMKDLMDTYGDQLVAAAVYNGGPGAVEGAQERAGKPNISMQDLVNHYDYRRKHHPTKVPSAWQNETYRYVKDIGSNPLPTNTQIASVAPATPAITPM